MGERVRAAIDVESTRRCEFMRHGWPRVLAACCLLAGCSGQPAPASTQSPDGWVVTDDGAGPVQLGMSRGELTARGGAVNSESDACEYVVPQDAPTGVRAMV